MRADRLLKLADFLETVPRKAFNLSTWESSKATKPEGKRPGDCGFAGCAVGWAAHAKLFRGFRLVNGWPVISGPNGERFDDWPAVISAFDLTLDTTSFGSMEAEYLFYDGSYPFPHNPTPRQVAKRIRKFVRDHTPTGTTP